MKSTKSDAGSRTSASNSFWELAHARMQMNENQRINDIINGFDVSWAIAAKTTFAMKPADFQRLLNFSPATCERRRKYHKPLDCAASERLDRLAEIAIHIEAIFEDKDKAVEWLTTPNIALGGHAPLIRCETAIGTLQVQRVLNAMEWGGVV